MPPLEEVIQKLGLTPLGFEGGYYRETSRSEDVVQTPRGTRSRSTSIFYLLGPDHVGLMHRLQSDEIYHFYLGDPVELLLLKPSKEVEVVRLGSDLSSCSMQRRVEALTWQGSRLVDGGRYALMGTTMSPGFDIADFELGDRASLVREHPEHSAFLDVLTPEVIQTERLELRAATADLIHAERQGPATLAAGLNAEVGGAPIDDAALAQTLSALQESRDRRGWYTWYVIDRDARRLIGRADLGGPPIDGITSLVVHVRKQDDQVRAALTGWAAARGACIR